MYMEDFTNPPYISIGGLDLTKLSKNVHVLMSLVILNYMHSTLGNRTTLTLDDIDDYTEQVYGN